jgi:hypothetical protein
MVSSETLNSAQKDEIYCKPTEWTDVVKFFLFNYGLHALTVISEPGDGPLQIAITVMGALLMPYAGMARALFTILRGPAHGKSPLEKAARARALCMIVPSKESKDMHV